MKVKHTNKEGEDVFKRVHCDSKIFNNGIVYVPVWR
jgi:hypothetical protein